MGYSENEMSDYGNARQFDRELLSQLKPLGFDTQTDIPATFSYVQVREGFDFWEQIRQHLVVRVDPKDKTVAVNFNFRAIRDEDASKFVLTNIEVQLYSTFHDIWEKKAEKSYSSSSTLPTKHEMIGQIIYQAGEMEKMAKRMFGHDASNSLKQKPNNNQNPGIR